MEGRAEERRKKGRGFQVEKEAETQIPKNIYKKEK